MSDLPEGWLAEELRITEQERKAKSLGLKNEIKDLIEKDGVWQ